MGQIRWTEKASSNLQAIFEYISRDSKIYAARYVKALIRAAKKLETVPRVDERFLSLKTLSYEK
jgi:plasmid stabilization system protein ParE